LESMVSSLFSDSSTPSGGATIDDGRILRIRPPNHQSLPPPTVPHANPETQRLRLTGGSLYPRGFSPEIQESRRRPRRRRVFFFFLGEDEKHEIVTCYRILPL
jgi:hypothetical protein